MAHWFMIIFAPLHNYIRQNLASPSFQYLDSINWLAVQVYLNLHYLVQEEVQIPCNKGNFASKTANL